METELNNRFRYTFSISAHDAGEPESSSSDLQSLLGAKIDLTTSPDPINYPLESAYSFDIDSNGQVYSIEFYFSDLDVPEEAQVIAQYILTKAETEDVLSQLIYDYDDDGGYNSGIEQRYFLGKQQMSQRSDSLAEYYGRRAFLGLFLQFDSKDLLSPNALMLAFDHSYRAYQMRTLKHFDSVAFGLPSSIESPKLGHENYVIPEKKDDCEVDDVVIEGKND